MHNNQDKIHYTYKITHPNRKYYVGRRSCNCDPYKDSYMGSGKWVKSIKDKSVLNKEIIEIFDNFDDLCIGEETLISEYWDDEFCMNYTKFSRGMEHHTEETRKKQAEARIGRFTGENSHNWGRKHTEETKKKVSDAKLGAKFTEEHKNNISKARIGKFTGAENPFFGKKHSEDTRKKLSESHKGIIQTEKTRKRKSVAFSGEKNPRSTLTESIVTDIKIKMSLGAKNSILAKEYNTTRDIISAIRIGRTWAFVSPKIDTKSTSRKDTKNLGNAKLNEEIVREIKIKLASGSNYKSLVETYKVGKTTISNIATGKTWKDVTI